MNRLTMYGILTALAAAAPAAAHADGFVSAAGMSQGCHFATESTMAAYAADGAGAIHHGALPALATATGAGTDLVCIARQISLAYDAAGAILHVQGCSPSATVSVTSMDGRTMACTAAGEGHIGLQNLTPGLYIVHVADTSASASIKIAR